MKNVSSLIGNKADTPKTPGGISKSLLTPCRRVGLSRNWKKAGPSPFISPLSSNKSSIVEIKEGNTESRKRKQRGPVEELKEECDDTVKTLLEPDDLVDTYEGDGAPSLAATKHIKTSTPSRQVELPRKKSKTIISAISDKKVALEEKDIEDLITMVDSSIIEAKRNMQKENVVSTPALSKSKSRIKKSISSPKILGNTKDSLSEPRIGEDINKNKRIPNNSTLNVSESTKVAEKEVKTDYPKTNSPKELTKECFVVVQKKIFKTNKIPGKRVDKGISITEMKISQVDSDSDDVPLNKLSCKENINEDNHLNKTEETQKINKEPITIDVDDDFTVTEKQKVKKLEDKSTSIGGLKPKKPKQNKKFTKMPTAQIQSKPSSQSSFDDDEDFDFDNKKTILIRKTYDKVTKPLKAKSTGSITQRDIDELKARIESKKKLLLARVMTEDTEELRGLIKKWQKGCQDALMELMDLMKTKFPDKQNMDYSEILQMLKIPATLVGYSCDDDCFNTPDDANVILSKFNDI